MSGLNSSSDGMYDIEVGKTWRIGSCTLQGIATSVQNRMKRRWVGHGCGIIFVRRRTDQQGPKDVPNPQGPEGAHAP